MLSPDPAHCAPSAVPRSPPVEFKTTDLCDQYGDEVIVCQSIFRDYGGVRRFAGPAATIKCFEDNSRVRDLTAEPGQGRVLAIDAGGSLRRAVLGDLLAAKAAENGWCGVVVFGVIRDSGEISALQFGVKALGTCPRKTDKLGAGERDIDVEFGGVRIRPGDWLCADEDGVVVADTDLRPML